VPELGVTRVAGSVTVTHVGPGNYTLTASGLGNGCSIPMLTSEGSGVTEFFTGGGCTGPGAVSTTVLTADGQDQDWAFTLVGTDPPSAAATAQARTLSRKSFPAATRN
jgi:hypothetical protein